MTSVKLYGDIKNGVEVQIHKGAMERLLNFWVRTEHPFQPSYIEMDALLRKQSTGTGTDEVCALISESIPMAVGMVELRVEYVPFNPRIFDMIYQLWVVPNRQSLKILRICHSRDISQSEQGEPDSFFTDIVNDPAIQLEYVYYNNYRRKPSSYLSAPQTQRNLRRLELSEMSLDKNQTELLVRTVSENSSTLVYLELHRCSLDAEGMDVLYKGLADLADRRRLNLQTLSLCTCEVPYKTDWSKYVSNPRFWIRNLDLPKTVFGTRRNFNFMTMDNFYLLKMIYALVHFPSLRNKRLLKFMHQEAVEAFHVARALDVLNECGEQNPKSLILPNEIIERILYFFPEMPILSKRQILKIQCYSKNGGQIKDMGSEKVDIDFLKSVDCQDLEYFDFTETFKSWANHRFLYSDEVNLWVL